jgi:hypothetical protein
MRDNGQNAETTRIRRPAAWESYVATAIGADHIRAGMPNQDCAAASRLEVADGGLVVAVADGHGHTRHFRSDRGSKLAVAAAMSVAKDWTADQPSRASVQAASAGKLVAEVVAAWRAMVAADLAEDPITGSRLAALPPDDPAEIPYGATLLLAVLLPEVAVLAQIGDGELLLVLPDGRHLLPVPTDSRLDGTRTTSLCQPDAISAFRVGLVNLVKTPVYAVLAATDGYGNAQADARWQQVLCADLVRLGSENGSDWIGGQRLGHDLCLVAG